MPVETGAVEERLGPEPGRHLGGDHPREDPDDVGDPDEDRHHDDAGEDAGGRNHGDRVAADGVEGLDLLGDLHRSELRRDARADAPHEDDGGEHGAELEDHARDDDAPEDVERDASLELVAALLARDDPGENGRYKNDRDALDPHYMDLLEDGGQGDA